MKQDEVFPAVLEELGEARKKFPPFNSCHEGFAVIQEEVDELWRDIKMKHKDMEHIRNEAIQVAAMGIRFVLDLCCEKEETLETLVEGLMEHLTKEEGLVGVIDKLSSLGELTTDKVEEFMNTLLNHPYAKDGFKNFPEVKDILIKYGEESGIDVKSILESQEDEKKEENSEQ